MATLQDIDNLFKSESNIYLDTTQFREHILTQLDIAGLKSNKDSLLKELAKSEKEADKFIQETIDEHNERFDMLQQYIQAEYDSTAELQNILDMITDEKL